LKEEFGPQENDENKYGLVLVIREFYVDGTRSSSLNVHAFFEVYKKVDDGLFDLIYEHDDYAQVSSRGFISATAPITRILANLWRQTFYALVANQKMGTFSQQEIYQKYIKREIEKQPVMKNGAYRTPQEFRSNLPGLTEFDIDTFVVDEQEVMSFDFHVSPKDTQRFKNSVFAVCVDNECYLNLRQLAGVEGWAPILNIGKFCVVDGTLENGVTWSQTATFFGAVGGGLIGGTLGYLIVKAINPQNDRVFRKGKKYGGMSIYNTDNEMMANMSKGYAYLKAYRNKDLLHKHGVKYKRKMDIEERFELFKKLNELIAQEQRQ
jgi:hypothetical protein